MYYSGMIDYSRIRASLNTMSGESLDLPVTHAAWDDLTKEYRVECVGNAGRVALRIAQKESLQILYVQAELFAADPRFGYQKYLKEREGVCLELDLTTTGSFMANYQHKEWWMRPAFGNWPGKVPPQTQLLILRGETDHTFRTMLAVCSDARADISSNDTSSNDLFSSRTESSEGSGSDCRLVVSLSSNLSGQKEIPETPVLVCGCGADPYALVDKSVRTVQHIQQDQAGSAGGARNKKELPDTFRKFGWCTWDSLGHDVSEEAIFKKMEELRSKQVPVAWVLIDDGWSAADYDNLTLTGIDADPVRFPHGLAHTIRTLKEKYQVEQVGVWQAIKGYWNGIAPGSEAERFFSQYLQRYPNGEITYRMTAEASFGFWNKWHAYLKKAGVDFIKVDSQSSMSILLQGQCGFGEASEAIHTGLDASAVLHFQNRLINCMGMAPEDIWHRPNSVISRSSDDYTPTVKGSFGEHALANSYNSILHGCFYIGDWDMVWTQHEEAQESILLRAISGGPFYISDGEGKTDPKALAPVLGQGGTVFLCDGVGRPLLPCLTDTGVLKDRPLYIYNTCGPAVYVAAFTYADADIMGAFRVPDVPERAWSQVQEGKPESAQENRPPESYLPSMEAFWVYDWFAGTAQRISLNETVETVLSPRQCGLYQILPDDGITVLGLVDHYISRAAVIWEETCKNEKRFILSEDGVLGILADLPEEFHLKVFQEGKELQVSREGSLFKVHCKAGKMILIK